MEKKGKRKKKNLLCTDANQSQQKQAGPSLNKTMVMASTPATM
jgi:hypothetical protein